MLTYTLIPAYGRDYKTAQACYKAWVDGKDFEIATVAGGDAGRMCSIRDAVKLPGSTVKIRYDQKSEFIVVNISTGIAKDSDNNILTKPHEGPDAWTLLKQSYEKRGDTNATVDPNP